MQRKVKLLKNRDKGPSKQIGTQLPDDKVFTMMRQMCCGGFDDPSQQIRIFNMSQSIPHNPQVAVTKTDVKNPRLTEDWEKLFKLFYPSEERSTRRGGGENKKEIIKNAFDQISDEDPLKKALLAVHTKEYVYKILNACIDAQTGKEGTDKPEDRYIELGEDINIQIHTFEVLMRDFATTVYSFEQQKEMGDTIPIFSLGLPTHHAHQDNASGFCIFNKTAMLIAYFEQQNSIICGLDINADNGLQDCLTKLVNHGTTSPQTILHYDVYDSQVWPEKKYSDANIQQAQSAYYYKSIDMKDDVHNRKKNAIHPVLQNLINEITKQAKEHGSNLAIYIALGWDSHQEETASCARVILDDEAGEEKYRIEKRFNDNDFRYFYEQLFILEKEYKIKFLYIGLEGGYTQKVYQQQTRVLVETACAVGNLYEKSKVNNEIDIRDKSEENEIEEESSNSKKRKNVIKPKDSASESEFKKNKTPTVYPPKLLDANKNTPATPLESATPSTEMQKKQPLRRSPRKRQ